MPKVVETLPPDSASVPAARRFVCQALEDWGLARVCEAVEMLVSELVTNAVLHARTGLTLRVACEGATVRVAVEDGSAVIPRQRSYGLDSTTGRGLRLVETMSADWGIDPVPGGKVIWFEVSADDDSPERQYQAWDDDGDVDALLAAFGDDDHWEPTGPSAALARVAA